MTDEHEDAEPGTEVLLFERELDARPEKVWKALTDPALRAQWLMNAEVLGRRGEHFSLRGDSEHGPREVTCELIESEHPRSLRYRWRDADDPSSDSIVSFTLTRTARGGTLLRLTHAGLRAQPRVEASGAFRCAA